MTPCRCSRSLECAPYRHGDLCRSGVLLVLTSSSESWVAVRRCIRSVTGCLSGWRRYRRDGRDELCVLWRDAGTAWVNTFQTVLFLLFGAVALIVIGAGMGGFRSAAQSMLTSPAFAPLLTRERISPLYFFSYTFIPLSAIAFPHILIFCLTARKMGQFKKTVIFIHLYSRHLAACVFLV